MNYAQALAEHERIEAEYDDGGYAAGDGPVYPMEAMDFLLAEVARLTEAMENLRHALSGMEETT